MTSTQIGGQEFWTATQRIKTSISPYFSFFFSWGMIIIISLIILWIQLTHVELFDVLSRYNSIKNNMGNWSSNILNFELLEKQKNKTKIPFLKPEIRTWKCFDGGLYYIPLKMGDNFLPTSIRRGNGGAWKIKKGVGQDEAALQFCSFLIRERAYETIQCGLDAFDKTGNSGLFAPSHWCKKDWLAHIKNFEL